MGTDELLGKRGKVLQGCLRWTIIPSTVYWKPKFTIQILANKTQSVSIERTATFVLGSAL